MIIRSETSHDYPQINRVHIRAFGGRLDEALIVVLQRQRILFDPNLALVAEDGKGRVLGHALFSPCEMRLLGQPVRVVVLGPIGVDPEQQGQGIGSALIEEGHRVARETGYALCSLLGHPTYYPRFGYRTGVHGGASVEVMPAPHTPAAGFVSRPPQESDLSALHALWLHEEREVDFACDPGQELLDWVSPNPLIDATVYLRDDVVVGYTRVKQTEPHAVRVFLAADEDAARSIVAALVMDESPIRLPLHPYSASARFFPGAASQGWEAGMACPLLPDGPFDEFYARMQAERQPPGRTIWGTGFDFG